MRAPSQTCNDAAPDDAHETVFEPSDVNGLAVLDEMGIQLPRIRVGQTAVTSGRPSNMGSAVQRDQEHDANGAKIKWTEAALHSRQKPKFTEPDPTPKTRALRARLVVET
jgi:hypothetical protein